MKHVALSPIQYEIMRAVWSLWREGKKPRHGIIAARANAPYKAISQSLGRILRKGWVRRVGPRYFGYYEVLIDEDGFVISDKVWMDAIIAAQGPVDEYAGKVRRFESKSLNTIARETLASHGRELVGFADLALDARSSARGKPSWTVDGKPMSRTEILELVERYRVKDGQQPLRIAS